MPLIGIDVGCDSISVVIAYTHDEEGKINILAWKEFKSGKDHT